jgi:phage antirepressor YoqD-like protein
MSGRGLNKLLHGLGVQYYQDRQWLLYAKYQGKGYTHSQTIEFTRLDGSTDSQLHTQWTQAGRLFIYELLKSKGILPLIERIA